MVVNVRIEGLDKIQKEYGSGIVKEYINDGIKKSLLVLEREMKIQSPIDRGVLRSSFQSQFFDLKGVLLNPTNYAMYVNDGTRPHTPPFKVIEARATRHGMNPGAVRMSIRRKGTKANPYLDRGIDKSESKIMDIFDKAIVDLVHKLNEKGA